MSCSNVPQDGCGELIAPRRHGHLFDYGDSERFVSGEALSGVESELLSTFWSERSYGQISNIVPGFLICTSQHSGDHVLFDRVLQKLGSVLQAQAGHDAVLVKGYSSWFHV
jgi:hypothetical protein